MSWTTSNPLKRYGRRWLNAGWTALTAERLGSIRSFARRRELAAQYRLLIEHSPDVVARCSPDGTYLYASPACITVLGHDPAALIGQSFYDLVHAEDQTLVRSYHALIAQSPESQRFAYRVRRADDRYCWIESTGRGIFDQRTGSLLEMHFISRDVTEQRRAEEEISRQHEYLAVLHETSLALMNRLDVNDLLLTIVRWAAQLLGTSHGSVHVLDRAADEVVINVGIGVLESFVGLWQQRGEGIAGNVWITRKPVVINDYDAWEHRLAHFPKGLLSSVVGVPLFADQQVIGILVIAHTEPDRRFEPEEIALLQRFAQLAAIALDNARLYTSAQEELAERTRAEQALMKSEATNRALLSAIPDLMWRISRDGTFLDYRNGYEDDSTVRRPEAFLGKSITEVLPPDPAMEVEFYIERALASGDVQVFEYAITEDGAERHYEARIGVSGQDEVLAIIRDVSKRTRMEAALRESEARYRTMIASLGEGVMLLDSNGVITTCNASVERILKVSREQIIGRRLIDMQRHMIQEDGTAFAREDHPAIITLTQGNACTDVVMGISRENTPLIWLSINSQPLFDVDVTVPSGAVISFTDITARKQAEQALHASNAQLVANVAKLEQHNRELDLLGRLGELLQASETVDDAYQVIAELLLQLFPGTSGALTIAHPTQQMVEVVADWGDHTRQPSFPPLASCATRQCGIFSTDTKSQGEACTHFVRDGVVPGRYLCVPLIAQNGVLGMLHLAVTDATITMISPEQQQLAQTVARQLQLALTNLDLRASLRRQSVCDPLTGLFNRRYMEETLERESARVLREHTSLSIIMCDIDYFEHFNDTFGHDAGDALLREMASFLEHSVRSSDVVCRYGGEEFVLILPNASLEVAYMRAERIRTDVKQLQIEYADRILDSITMSFGVAVFSESSENVMATIKHADTALYQAKHSGRDRVVVAEMPEPAALMSES